MKEKISEFMDGEMDDAEIKRLIVALHQTDAHEEWHTYHLIGDQLRGASVVSNGFMQRFSERLAEEPTVLAPRRLVPLRQKRFALSAAASVAAVGFVVWGVMQANNESALSGMQVAANVPRAELVSTNVHSYLLAHQEYSPSVAMQNSAPYVRNVSEVREAAAR